MATDSGVPSDEGQSRPLEMTSSAPGATTRKSSQSERYLDALPGPLRAAVQFLLLDLIDPKDSLTQILRKVVLTAGACMFIHPVSYIGYFGYLIAQGAPIEGPACLIVACCVSMLSWSLFYLIARHLRDVPDALMDLWLVGTNTAFTLLIISMPQYPSTTCVFASAILTVLCNCRRYGFHLAWCAVLYLLQEYNEATAGTGFEGLVPGARYGPLSESLVNHMSGFFIAFTVMLALWVQTREHIRIVESSQAAVNAARIMAKQLAHYDTVAVQQTINDELGKAQIDAELLDAFASIADNLERYRPHLPNWMIHLATTPVDPDLESISNASHSSDTTKHSRATTVHSTSTPSDMGSSANYVPHMAGFHTPQGGSLRLSPRNKPGSVPRTRLVLARIRVAPTRQGESLNVLATDQLMAQIFSLADATQGSLHSFICDEIILSWNATHRIAQPEAKCARMLTKLKSVCSIQSSIASNLRVTGAAISTTAASRFAGPPGGQCTLHVSVPQYSATTLGVLSELAAHHDAFVVDVAIARASKHDIVTREVEAFSIPSGDSELPSVSKSLSKSLSTSPAQAAVHQSPEDLGLVDAMTSDPMPSDSTNCSRLTIGVEVLCERVHAMEEWMYVLDKTDRDVRADALVTMALRHAVAEQFDKASTVLEELDPTAVTPSPLLTRLRRRVATAAISAVEQGRFAFALEVSSARYACAVT